MPIQCTYRAIPSVYYPSASLLSILTLHNGLSTPPHPLLPPPISLSLSHSQAATSSSQMLSTEQLEEANKMAKVSTDITYYSMIFK